MEMQLNGTLTDYLADINEQAEEMFFQLVNDMAKAEGQMLWVQNMNSVRERASEAVYNELIRN